MDIETKEMYTEIVQRLLEFTLYLKKQLKMVT